MLQAAVAYVESRIRGGVDRAALSSEMGVSDPHFRAIWRDKVGLTFGKYVLERRISHAAFELAHTERSALDIACAYGFTNPDTFTRAFRRVTGLVPSEFRARRVEVGRVKLGAGAFGPGLPGLVGSSRPTMDYEEDAMKSDGIEKSENSCVLYGVRRVQYCYEECTPFPAALRSCLNYLGQEINYAYLMAATGAAFRLRWNPECWDGGNVDIMAIYEDPSEGLTRGLRAAGRSWRMLGRQPSVTKADFAAFIKAEIDSGRPVIAFGIIGPPEACIVTGYRDGGDTLLGWNFFQDNPEFASGSGFDASGYFITSVWWENPQTILLIAVGEERGTVSDSREILTNALDVLTRERVRSYLGGQAAYDEWIAKITDEGEFPEGMILPKLGERLMCEIDAQTMVGEGRAYAAEYLKTVAVELDAAGRADSKRLADLAREAEAAFRGEFELTKEMWSLPGFCEDGEKKLLAFARRETRLALAERARKAKDLDRAAADAIRRLLDEWK